MQTILPGKVNYSCCNEYDFKQANKTEVIRLILETDSIERLVFQITGY